MQALADKVVAIVGGTTGMGLSAARACARAGAKLAVLGRDDASSAAAAAELGEDALVLTGDAAEAGTAQRCIDAAVERFGAIHGLYHVAGGSGRRMGDGPLHELTDDGWQYTLRLNLTSVFYSNRAAVRQFLRQGRGGSILNMGSVVAFSPSPVHFGTHAYAAAKAAIIALSTSAAATYAGQNIRVNVIAPALTDTPMAARAMGDESIGRYIRSKQPLDGGRAGRPEDLDGAVVYFLSDGSRFVTGQVLAVDGGWSVTEAST